MANTIEPILLVGGSGIVGRWAARFLREAHPEVPLLIGGRDRAGVEEAASEISDAQGVTIDMSAPDLGLGERPVAAVAVLFTDHRVAGLRFAQSRGAAYVSISPGITELGPEVSAYIHNPHAAAVVLGTEWLVGATTVPALAFAEAFGRLDAIAISAVLDEEDAFGPAARSDLERQTKTVTAALARRDGAWVWRGGDEARTVIHAADGVALEASAFSPNDVFGLASATGAPNVVFDLAIGESSSRRRGEPVSTEIIIDLTGNDHQGHPLHTRHVVVHPGGQMPLTGLGVALVLERLVGLAGDPPPAGLYFPYQLLDRAQYLARLQEIGGKVIALDV